MVIVCILFVAACIYIYTIMDGKITCDSIGLFSRSYLFYYGHGIAPIIHDKHLSTAELNGIICVIIIIILFFGILLIICLYYNNYLII